MNYFGNLLSFPLSTDKSKPRERSTLLVNNLNILRADPNPFRDSQARRTWERARMSPAALHVCVDGNPQVVQFCLKTTLLEH